MTDLINPSLLARVERSLRKRVKSDVHPHLLRCAAHAHSDDEFVASAARLLLDPKERQQWLAVWTWRLQHPQSADTMPADFEITSSDTLESLHHAANSAPRQNFQSAIATPVQIQNLREALSRELGESASDVLERELRAAESPVDLMERIETHLVGENQRVRFRDAAAVAFSA